MLRGFTAPSPSLFWEFHCRLPECPLPPVSLLGATRHLLQLGGSSSTRTHRDGVWPPMGPTPHSHGSVSAFSSWIRV